MAMTTYHQEFEIARIRVGETKDRELNSILQPKDWKGAAGHLVVEPSGLVAHYYTTKKRTAVLCATCRDGVVQAVRLKKGFWGPLSELPELPVQSLSDCSLECLGTYHSVNLGPRKGFMAYCHGQERVLERYGPPTRESENKLEYDWFYGQTPRRMTFGLQGPDEIIEMHLELVDPSLAQVMRPLAPAQPYERMPRIPPELEEVMREGERHLKERRPAQAEACFAQVFQAIAGDGPWLHDNASEVAVRLWQARAATGRVKDAVARVEALYENLKTYATYNPPEVLRAWLALGQVRRLAGDARGAKRDLLQLWEAMQESNYYAQPEVQHLVRKTAEELALLGEGRYLEAVRSYD